jgi:hypothetical protein
MFADVQLISGVDQCVNFLGVRVPLGRQRGGRDESAFGALELGVVRSCCSDLKEAMFMVEVWVLVAR